MIPLGPKFWPFDKLRMRISTEQEFARTLSLSRGEGAAKALQL
jgi:hypothetical protein